MRTRIHSLPGLMVVVIFAFIAGGIIYYYSNAGNSENSTNTISTKKSNSSSNQESNATTNSTSTGSTSDWKEYSNLTFNYSIKYPKDWKYKEGKDIQKSPAQEYTQFSSPNFSWGETPEKKIEKGYLVVVRVLPIGATEGYSSKENIFQDVKEIQIDSYNATEYIVKSIDDVENQAPAQIKFETKENLVLIDGWFSSQNKKEFINIYEKMAKTFQIK